MSDNLDAVMRRIQKLLAMAEDGRGDPNEAAAAASMAAENARLSGPQQREEDHE